MRFAREFIITVLAAVLLSAANAALAAAGLSGAGLQTLCLAEGLWLGYYVRGLAARDP